MIAVEASVVGRRLKLKLSTGKAMDFDLDRVPALREANFSDLSDVQLLDQGTAVHWPKVKTTMTVIAIVAITDPETIRQVADRISVVNQLYSTSVNEHISVRCDPQLRIEADRIFNLLEAFYHKALTRLT